VAFESEGVLTSLDGIALRAGVGNATLYRNFPTRDDLVAAVAETAIAGALVEADELTRSLPPREALAEWLARLTWKLRIYHDLPSCAVAVLDEHTSALAVVCAPLLERTAVLIDAAKAADACVEDVRSDEVFELLFALSWAVDRFRDDEDAARRRVALATAGIFRSGDR
jgi:AcrR family transcriptional regulator